MKNQLFARMGVKLEVKDEHVNWFKENPKEAFMFYLKTRMVQMSSETYFPMNEGITEDNQILDDDGEFYVSEPITIVTKEIN